MRGCDGGGCGGITDGEGDSLGGAGRGGGGDSCVAGDGGDERDSNGSGGCCGGEGGMKVVSRSGQAKTRECHQGKGHVLGVSL